jgi:hypothetical protein
MFVLVDCFEFRFVKNLKLSRIFLEKIQSKQILFKRLNRSKTRERHLQFSDWLDGSELITIECAINELRIKSIPLNFHHVWQFFRLTDSSFRFKDKTLYVDESFNFLMSDENRLSQYIQCSLICSKFIDRKEINVFFPWIILKKIIETYCYNPLIVKRFEAKAESLERYRYTNAVYGDDFLNIEKVIFKDKKIYVNFLFAGIKFV